MTTLKYKKIISIKFLVGLSLIVLIGILIFGLNPKGFYFSNGINWIADRPGIHFEKYSIAYSDPLIEPIEGDISDPNGFSIEIALKSESYQEEGFNLILLLHNGEDSSQLLMGQWHAWIILMNGDDYDHKRKTKRISVDTASMPSKERFVTITTGKEGTKVYFDGQLMHERKDLTLKIPGEDKKARLVIGNSVHGHSSWKGDIYGLALYGYVLTDQKISANFDRWSKDQNFFFIREENPYALYPFDGGGGSGAHDYSGGDNHLEIPSRMIILEKEILSSPLKGFRFDSKFVQDVIINLAGFIPFGFILSATLFKFGGTFERHGLLIAVVSGFTVSLIIEIAQAWIPSRSSSALDLMLNTVGTWIGGAMAKYCGEHLA